MNDSDKLTDKEMQQFIDAKPGWQSDGKGIRGDVVQISNSKAQLNWETKVVYRRPELNAGA